jgi:cell wall assembly regulator SMI1
MAVWQGLICCSRGGSLSEGENLKTIEELVAELDPREPPATAEQIRAAEAELGRTLPVDYVYFLMHANGYEGFAHSNHYLRLDGADELAEVNRGYQCERWRPGVVCFGGDRGGNGWFFEYLTPGPTVLDIAFISNWHKDAFWAGDSFTDFLDRILRGWSAIGNSPDCRRA